MHNEVFNLTKPSLMILYQESSVHKTVTTSPSITYHQPLSDFSFAKTRLLRHNLQRQRVQLMTNWGPSSDDKRVYASSLVPCTNCGEYGCNKCRCPKPPFERKMAGREGLKAAGQALSIKAATRSARVTYNPSPNLPEMERMGDNNGDIFMEDESGNIWWRDC